MISHLVLLSKYTLVTVDLLLIVKSGFSYSSLLFSRTDFKSWEKSGFVLYYDNKSNDSLYLPLSNKNLYAPYKNL
jgi:hypothetical protein